MVTACSLYTQAKSEAYSYIPSFQADFQLGRDLAKKTHTNWIFSVEGFSFSCFLNVGVLCGLVCKLLFPLGKRQSFSPFCILMQSKLVIIPHIRCSLWSCFGPCFGPNFSFCLQYHVASHSSSSAFLNSVCSVSPSLDICHFSLKIILLLKIMCSPWLLTVLNIFFVLFLYQRLPPFIIKMSISFLNSKTGKI